jgi:hypothetical protein
MHLRGTGNAFDAQVSIRTKNSSSVPSNERNNAINEDQKMEQKRRSRLSTSESVYIHTTPLTQDKPALPVSQVREEESKPKHTCAFCPR